MCKSISSAINALMHCMTSVSCAALHYNGASDVDQSIIQYYVRFYFIFLGPYISLCQFLQHLIGAASTPIRSCKPAAGKGLLYALSSNTVQIVSRRACISFLRLLLKVIGLYHTCLTFVRTFSRSHGEDGYLPQSSLLKNHCYIRS